MQGSKDMYEKFIEALDSVDRAAKEISDNIQTAMMEKASNDLIRCALDEDIEEYIVGSEKEKSLKNTLDFDTYQKLAQRTSGARVRLDKLENGLMGLNGEAGECIDILKKYKFQGHALDKNKLVDELGDVLWYCAELAEGLNISLAEVAERNIDKLFKRYPEGFKSEKSINREGEE